MTAYPEPEFPIGHVVYNRLDEPLTVVGQHRSDQIMARGDCRLFSDEETKRTPWFYTLRDPDGRESSSSQGGLRHMEQMRAGRRFPTEADHPIPSTQRGRASRGEKLRSPHGAWTVAESWIASKPGAQGTDRNYTSPFVSGGDHVYYLLTHEDGHQEEWAAPSMTDFHRILPDE